MGHHPTLVKRLPSRSRHKPQSQTISIIIMTVVVVMRMMMMAVMMMMKMMAVMTVKINNEDKGSFEDKDCYDDVMGAIENWNQPNLGFSFP